MVHSSTLKSSFEMYLGYLPQGPFDLEFMVNITLLTSKEERAIVRAQRFLERIKQVHIQVEQ